MVSTFYNTLCHFWPMFSDLFLWKRIFGRLASDYSNNLENLIQAKMHFGKAVLHVATWTERATAFVFSPYPFLPCSPNEANHIYVFTALLVQWLLYHKLAHTSWWFCRMGSFLGILDWDAISTWLNWMGAENMLHQEFATVNSGRNPASSSLLLIQFCSQNVGVVTLCKRPFKILYDVYVLGICLDACGKRQTILNFLYDKNNVVFHAFFGHN